MDKLLVPDDASTLDKGVDKLHDDASTLDKGVDKLPDDASTIVRVLINYLMRLP